jgi:hypothetical protein
MPWAKVNPVVEGSVRDLCMRPYPGHKKGCPNFGKKTGCPPTCPYIDEILDLKQDVWAIWSTFDLGSHVSRMRELHPGWSDRQLVCCLYWQPKARIVLRGVIRDFLVEHPGLVVVQTPEAAGVQLTTTMEQVGEVLEWPPVTKTYQIVLAGSSVSEPGIGNDGI